MSHSHGHAESMDVDMVDSGCGTGDCSGGDCCGGGQHQPQQPGHDHGHVHDDTCNATEQELKSSTTQAEALAATQNAGALANMHIQY